MTSCAGSDALHHGVPPARISPGGRLRFPINYACHRVTAAKVVAAIVQ
jgi:hypothetical protein